MIEILPHVVEQNFYVTAELQMADLNGIAPPRIQRRRIEKNPALSTCHLVLDRKAGSLSRRALFGGG
jgi:hypothetical protein